MRMGMGRRGVDCVRGDARVLDVEKEVCSDL